MKLSLRGEYALRALIVLGLSSEKEVGFGRLAVGERADFLVLDRDPLMSNAEEIRQTKVLQSWIGGVRVYGGETAVPDEERRRVTR
jgi:predicted amidohydrolase YtcJ